MEEKVIVKFINIDKDEQVDIEIPLHITAMDLVLALNETFSLGMNSKDVFSCYLVAENPIAFLRGNTELSKFGIRNGTRIVFRRS